MLKHLAWLPFCLPFIASAETPFAGTWVVTPELTTFALRPMGLMIDRGVYRRTSCVPDDSLPADGAEHAVVGDPWAQTMSVRVLDDHRVEMAQKIGGKLTWKGTYVVSKDGKSMQLKFEDSRPAKAVSGKIEFARIGDAVSNAHLVSGDWMPQKVLELSASGRSVTFQDTDNGLIMTASDGRGFDIHFDRKDYPLNGYLEGATVQVGRRAAMTLQVNRKQHGALIEMSLGTVSADGQTMELGVVDWQCQSKILWTLHKQPAT